MVSGMGLELIDGVTMAQVRLHTGSSQIRLDWWASIRLTALQLTVVVPMTLMIPLNPATINRLSKVTLS